MVEDDDRKAEGCINDKAKRLRTLRALLYAVAWLIDICIFAILLYLSVLNSLFITYDYFVQHWYTGLENGTFWYSRKALRLVIIAIQEGLKESL